LVFIFLIAKKITNINQAKFFVTSTIGRLAARRHRE